MTRRAKTLYFPRNPGDPAPLRLSVTRRARLSEVDPLGIVWFGNYARFFEEASTELGRRCGLSYADFREARLLAPIAQFHVDYLTPIRLDEPFTVSCSYVWNPGARLNAEYEIAKPGAKPGGEPGGEPVARGWSVQLFLDAAADLRVCVLTPPLLERCRERWLRGEWKDLQT